MLRKTHEKFVEQLSILFNDNYNTVDKYQGDGTKILMHCNICSNEWSPYPTNLLRGHGCPRCAGLEIKTTDIFKQEVFILTGNEYSVLGEYINNRTNILLKHNTCEYEFNMLPTNFSRGQRCPKCFGKFKKSQEQFNKEVKNTVGSEYSVLGAYQGTHKNILFKHNSCGNEFLMSPAAFLYQIQRCPNCINISKGENKIKEYLVKHSISFKTQYRINECKNKRPLPFDFAIIDRFGNVILLIEYDGNLHYDINNSRYSKNITTHDKIKTQYCLDNNIKLIRIPYWEFKNIEDILNKELKEIS